MPSFQLHVMDSTSSGSLSDVTTIFQLHVMDSEIYLTNEEAETLDNLSTPCNGFSR